MLSGSVPDDGPGGTVAVDTTFVVADVRSVVANPLARSDFVVDGGPPRSTSSASEWLDEGGAAGAVAVVGGSSGPDGGMVFGVYSTPTFQGRDDCPARPFSVVISGF